MSTHLTCRGALVGESLGLVAWLARQVWRLWLCATARNLALIGLLLGTATGVSAQVNYLSSSQTTTGGVVPTGGTLTAGINYSVQATTNTNAVGKVALYEGTTVLASITYRYQWQWINGEQFPINTPRTDTLSADFAAGTHHIFVRSTTDAGQTGDSPTYTVTVTAAAPPTVTRTSPVDGANYPVPVGTNANVSVVGNATSANASIVKLEVLDGSTVLTSTTASSINTAVSLASGSHHIALRATDSFSQVTTGSVANVTVTGVSAPTVTLTSPVNGTQYIVGANGKAAVPVAGSATATNGSITKLEVLDGSTVVTSVAASSINANIDFSPGSHAIALRATNNVNVAVTSSVANITVPQPAVPVVSMTAPANPVTYSVASGTSASVQVTGSATVSGATIAKMEVLDGSTVIKSVTGSSINTNVSLAAGSHSIALRATSSQAATATSSPIVVTVKAVGAPVVSMSAPVDGANYSVVAGGSANVTVTGSATASNGSVDKIEILDGSSVLSTVNAASVNTTVALSGGGHSIALRATNNVGVASTGSAAYVTVTSGSPATPIPVTGIQLPVTLANDGGTLGGRLGASKDGAATYSIPIAVPPGTAGLVPKLSLEYSSQGTDGFLGLGWSFSGLSSIHRCGKTIAQDGVNDRITFTHADRLCLDGQRLVLANLAQSDDNYWADGAEYRTEIDGFGRITMIGANASGGFKVEAKDGRLLYYGYTGASPAKAASPTSVAQVVIGHVNSTATSNQPQPNPADKLGALSWAISSIQDRIGNYLNFSYTQDNVTGEHRPDVIRYGGVALASHAAVQFVYQGRPDAWTKYVDEARNDLRSRITHIKTWVAPAGGNLDGDVTQGVAVQDYALTYKQSASSGRSLIDNVQVCGRNPQTGVTECLPKTSFAWGQPDPAKTPGFVSRGTWSGAPILTTTATINGVKFSATHSEYFAFIDFENHGRADILEKRIASPIAPTIHENERLAYQLKDANSIAPGTMQNQYRYFHNNGAGFTAYTYKLDTGEDFVVLEVGDFNGDGAPDLLVTAGSAHVPKICLSPLSAGLTSPPGSMIVFTCDTTHYAALGDNDVHYLPYVADVLGDGRSAIYSKVSDALTATLCIQASCMTDPNPPRVILGDESSNTGAEVPPNPLHDYVRFDAMIDFAGTGKPNDARWTKPYFGTTYTEDLKPRYNWYNLKPTVSMTGFLAPGSAGSRGSLLSYIYPTYPSPCPIGGCVSSDISNTNPAPYFFDTMPWIAQSGDFNGSGYQGLVFGFVQYSTNSYDRAEFTLCPSTGRALDCGIRLKYSGANYVAPRGVGNFVGDGAPRIMAAKMASGPSGPYPSGQILVCRVMGDDTTGGTGTNDSNIDCTQWAGPTLDNLGTHIYSMDLLGNGRTQLVYYHAGAYDGNNNWVEDGRWELFEPLDVAYAGQALDRIHAVTNGLGQVSSVEYADGIASGIVTQSGTSNLSYPQHPTTVTGKVVKRLSIGNGVSADRVTSYTYQDAGIDVAGRGSLGFAKVTTHDEQGGNTTTTTYAQAWPFTGMAVAERVVATDGTVLSDSASKLADTLIALANGNKSHFPRLGNHIVARRDLGGYSLGTVKTGGIDADGNVDGLTGQPLPFVQYDAWGNPLKSRTVSIGSGTADHPDATYTADTVNTYVAADTAHWLVGLLNRGSVTKSQSTDSNAIPRTIDYTYGNVLLSGGQSVSNTGLATRKVVQAIDPGITMKLTIDYGRDGSALGVITSTKQSWTDPLTGAALSATVNSTYDANGRYPNVITNALGHSETRAYDPGLGAVTSLRDPNDLLTTWEVDAFGRVTKQTQADGNEKRFFLKACTAGCPSGAAVAAVIEQYHGSDRMAVPQITFTDSAGHDIETMTWGYDGRKIIADKRYDNVGRLQEVDQPHYSADAAYLAKRVAYDTLDRERSVTTWDENNHPVATTTDYFGYRIVNTNGRSFTRTDLRNVLGQVEQTTDAKAGVTRFAYDAFGNLTKTTDPRLNVVTVSYDALGRRTQLSDPDLGQIDYTVDARGLVRQQVNPVERANAPGWSKPNTETQYDLLGRMIARLEPDLESHWVYDTATKGVGQLAEAYTGTSAAKDYDRVHSYDNLGRASTTSQQLYDAAYTSTPTYDIWSRVVTQTYQRGSDGPKLYDSRYNAYGYLNRIERGSLVLWQVQAQDAAQRATQASLGNGLTHTWHYSPYSGRMDSSLLQTAGAAVRLQEGYTFDPLGDVTHRDQQWDTNGFSEDFGYDELNRLTTSQVSSQAQKTFNYFADGSIRNKTGVGTGDYQYPTQGTAPRPHAVTGITGLSGSISYDDDGNLTAGLGRTASWTTFDMPVRISKTIGSTTYASTFAYGPEHQRGRQTRQDNSIVVYAGAQEVEINPQGQRTVKTYWPLGLGVEIDRPGAGTELDWIHTERLGSVVAITDASGALKEKLAYDAWGKRRSLDGASTADSLDGVTDNKGFTRHEMLDDLDLVHMNGRVYDPFTGRFISGDPLVQDPLNGQSYNRYSYVLNNPTNLTDPTGFTCEGGRAGLTSEKCGDWKPAGEPSTKGDLNLAERNKPPSDPQKSTDQNGNNAPGAKNMQPAATGGQAATGVVAALGEGMKVTKQFVAGWAVAGGWISVLDPSEETMQSDAYQIGKSANRFVGEVIVPTLRLSGWGGDSPAEAIGGVFGLAAKVAAPLVGGGAKLENLTAQEITRIQNAANRTGTPISVVGSRANGTARATSDWDYVIPEATKNRTIHSLRSSLPEGPKGLGEPRNQDFFKSTVDPNKPFITFTPQ